MEQHTIKERSTADSPVHSYCNQWELLSCPEVRCSNTSTASLLCPRFLPWLFNSFHPLADKTWTIDSAGPAVKGRISAWMFKCRFWCSTGGRRKRSRKSRMRSTRQSGIDGRPDFGKGFRKSTPAWEGWLPQQDTEATGKEWPQGRRPIASAWWRIDIKDWGVMGAWSTECPDSGKAFISRKEFHRFQGKYRIREHYILFFKFKCKHHFVFHIHFYK